METDSFLQFCTVSSDSISLPSTDLLFQWELENNSAVSGAKSKKLRDGGLLLSLATMSLEAYLDDIASDKAKVRKDGFKKLESLLSVQQQRQRLDKATAVLQVSECYDCYWIALLHHGLSRPRPSLVSA